MDPASVIGISAAVLTFIDAGYKALQTCTQICADPRSAATYNRELEQSARRIDELRQQLGATSRAKDTGRRIVDTAKECARLAVQLLDLLRHVRGDGQNIGKFKGTARALRYKKRIDDLQRVLEGREGVLGKILEQDTNVNVHAIRAELASSRQNVATIPRRMHEMQLQTRKNISTVHHNLHRRFDAAAVQAEKMHQEARHQEQLEKFLRSVWYPELDQRRSALKEAAPSTFEWIYRMRPRTGDASVDATKDWDDFGDWLRNDDSVYWICGKAGSGKSTLMSFIAENHRTRHHLEDWSSGDDLNILSHFFWRAGSGLQQSIEGVLRSLLFQLCQASPQRVEPVIQALTWSSTFTRPWTASTLVKALGVAMSAGSQTRFFILVDGLDEFRGDYDILVDLIFQLQADDQVKCCVSSRPEMQLRHRLSSCQQLLLQDLNRPDIEELVVMQCSGLLRSDRERDYLTQRIVDRAEGVFLWATLVCRSIIRGDRSLDRFELLLERLSNLPTELEELFTTMVENIDPVYRRDRLPFYLQCMKLSAEVALEHSYFNGSFLSTAWLMHAFEGPDFYLADAARACHQAETQVSSQSAGLLETLSNADATLAIREDLAGQGSRSLAAQSCGLNDMPAKQPQHTDPVSTETIMGLLSTRHRYTVWVHRSAYDFVFPTHGKPSVFDIAGMAGDEVLARVFRAALLWLKRLRVLKNSCFIPEAQRCVLRCTIDDLQTVTALCGQFSGRFADVTDRAMADLYTFCDGDESKTCSPRIQLGPDSSHWSSLRGTVGYWQICLEKYPDYAIRQWDQFIRDSAELSYILGLFRSIMWQFRAYGADARSRNDHNLAAHFSRSRVAAWLLGALSERLEAISSPVEPYFRTFLSARTDQYIYVARCGSSIAPEAYGDSPAQSFFGPLAEAMQDFRRARQTISQLALEDSGLSSTNRGEGSRPAKSSATQVVEIFDMIQTSLDALSTMFTLELHELVLDSRGYSGVLFWSSNFTRQSSCHMCASVTGHTRQDGTIKWSQSPMRLLCANQPRRKAGSGFQSSLETDQMWYFETKHMVTFQLGERSRKLIDSRLRRLSFEDMHTVGWLVSERTKLALSKEDLAAFETILISEIWENESGLDATEQLFALTYVRMGWYLWYRA